MSLDPAVRRELSGLHFAKEALSDNEKQTLYLAEQVMREYDRLVIGLQSASKPISSEDVDRLLDPDDWEGGQRVEDETPLQRHARDHHSASTWDINCRYCRKAEEDRVERVVGKTWADAMRAADRGGYPSSTKPVTDLDPPPSGSAPGAIPLPD